MDASFILLKSSHIRHFWVHLLLTPSCKFNCASHKHLRLEFIILLLSSWFLLWAVQVVALGDDLYAGVAWGIGFCWVPLQRHPITRQTNFMLLFFSFFCRFWPHMNSSFHCWNWLNLLWQVFFDIGSLPSTAYTQTYLLQSSWIWGKNLYLVLH